MKQLRSAGKRAGALAATTVIAAALTLGLTTGPAHAQVKGWTTVAEWGKPRGLALICKEYRKTGYGPVWRIKTAALSSRKGHVTINVRVVRPELRNAVVGSSKVYAANGRWAGGYTHASIVKKDRVKVQFDVGTTGMGVGSGSYYVDYSIGEIARCSR